MSTVYNQNYVNKVITHLRTVGEINAANLLLTLYEEAQRYKKDAEKAEGRLGSIGIPGYSW